MDQTGGITWTTTDLALFPEDGNRYETIDGQLFVTRALSWAHQKAAKHQELSFRMRIMSSPMWPGPAKLAWPPPSTQRAT
jgi:hypothetical protein